jgi:hypothetical protein
VGKINVNESWTFTEELKEVDEYTGSTNEKLQTSKTSNSSSNFNILGSFLQAESRFSLGPFSEEECFLLDPGELAVLFWLSDENFLVTSETAELEAPEDAIPDSVEVDTGG